MRFVIQRVLESEVKVDGESLGKIGKGFMVLIGVSNDDTKEVADKMVKKMSTENLYESFQIVARSVNLFLYINKSAL